MVAALNCTTLANETLVIPGRPGSRLALSIFLKLRIGDSMFDCLQDDEPGLNDNSDGFQPFSITI